MSSSDLQLPKLSRKRLDADAVAEHLRDVAIHGQAIQIRIKGEHDGQSEAAELDLDQVMERLRRNDIAAVQVVYLRDDTWWCDTVMRSGDIYRLVRMDQTAPA